ncbi:hypothetical protein HPB51_026982 [Rhipicephalus microplus]|uniref:Uncharacterized protein n=1 Tax=Rhipicephalus microplus TaxID=6941 RepID=A0A9J6D1D0_RHIMP|nr:hypothetical protein HPB51_026982 [Rhipicephalus microplus]
MELEAARAHSTKEHCAAKVEQPSRHFGSGDCADVRPPDTRLSTWGVESRLPGWVSERDLREAGCSKGTHQTKQSPVIRFCPGSRPSKTARLQCKATAELMPHRRHSYEDNFVNRQSQYLARLNLTEERDEVVVSPTDDDDDEDAKEMNGMDEVTSLKATVVYADGDGDGRGSLVGRRGGGDRTQEDTEAARSSTDPRLTSYFARTAASMEDSIEEDYGEGTQASSALIENTMPEPPVPTPGRGRRRATSARGRRTTAKPYERRNFAPTVDLKVTLKHASSAPDYDA